MSAAEELSPSPDAPMVKFALDYARRGWPVFPCKPTNKAPFFEGGFHVATADEETIRKWWGYWPKAMMGVPWVKEPPNVFLDQNTKQAVPLAELDEADTLDSDGRAA